MSAVWINTDFFDVFKTGLKVLRVEFNKEYTKVDLGFLYSEERKNYIKITDDIFLSDYDSKKKLIECTGINLNEDIRLKSVKDFRYFSLKFEPFDEEKEQLMLIQSNDDFRFSIIAIEASKK